jgi:murein DD-endopeptidase MepM/ murein hydrolase activator NlpD
VLGTLRVGSTVLHDDEQGGWLHVIDGWVSGDYVGDAAATILSPTLPAPPLLPGGLVHPLEGSVITQDFYQNPQAYAQFEMPGHDGTDFGGLPAGKPIRSMADGVVIRAAFDAPGYGNFVEVAHDAKGATTLYAHAQQSEVSVGQVVTAGQTIALLGTTGNSTGVHLHLSVRLINKDGSYREDCPMRKGRVDPRTWAAFYHLQL